MLDFRLAGLSLAICLAAGGPCAAGTTPLDDVVARAIQAMGGEASLSALTSLVFRGFHYEGSYKQEFESSKSSTAVMSRMRPNLRLVGCRPEVPGCEGRWGRILEGYDGQRGWEANWPKQRLVHTVGKADQALRCGAEFLPLFVDYKHRRFRARDLGMRAVLGAAYRAIQVDQAGCSSAIYYFDPATFRLKATELTIPIHARGELRHIASVVREYRTVAGVTLPSRSEDVDLATGEVVAGGQWTSIEANVLADRGAFEPPVVHPVGITAVVLKMLALAAAGAKPPEVLALYEQFRSTAEGASADVAYDMNWLGFELLKVDDYPNALAVLSQMVQEQPNSAAALESLGDAYAQKRDLKNARAAYEAALRMQPTSGSLSAKLRRLGAS